MRTTPNQKRLIEVGLYGLLLALDQAVKGWSLARSVAVINTGSFLGAGKAFPWEWILPLVWLVFGYIGRDFRGWKRWGMGFILTGGLSNWWDRVVYGGVVDMIYYPVFDFYGNIADISIALGIGLLILQAIKAKNTHDT